MEIISTKFEGLFIIKPKVFGDERGYFFESYRKDHLKDATGKDFNFIQDNESFSAKNVLRGMHFQAPPYSQTKLVRVVTGAVLDVVVDIRTNSETFGQHFALELNEDNKTQLLIPQGFAHGFLTLTDNTRFLYSCDNVYNKESEGSILWNDTDLGIDWPITENAIISDKDKIAPKFKNFNSPFTS